MFTGLVDRLGTVLTMRSGRLILDSGYDDLVLGESVAINGVCLTAVGPGHFAVVSETLKRTNLGALRKGDQVNLERALRPTDRLGGHFVQGHIDGTGVVRKNGAELRVEVSPEMASGIVPKGSIAVDGVSLTVVEVERESFSIALIHHTRKRTTLGLRRLGDKVNIELDLLGKYVRKQSRITPEFLRKAGFISPTRRAR
jgi:riboflavin synthase